MTYENYKQFFDGGFFPIDSDHKLVNLENSGEFEVTATTGSGADTKVTKHYLPSKVGLTNMLRNYTGGSKFEALTHSQGHTFIPELADCTSYTGAQKAIVNHFEQVKKPLIIDLNYSDADGKSIALTFETNTNRTIEWGDGEVYRGIDKAVNHQYAKKGNYRVQIYNWIDGQIKVQQTSELKISSPIYTTVVFDVNEMYVGYKSPNESYGSPSIEINTNNAKDQSEVSYLQFGFLNDIVNFNTGLAEWINLEEMKDTLGQVSIFAKNLYWDWKPLEFANTFEIAVYPDEITAKTAIEYFATKATTASGDKFSILIADAPGAQSIYNWAQQYADKFGSIEIS